MEFRLTQLGSIQKEMARARADLGRAAHAAMKRAGDALKDDLRADVAKSGMRNAARVSKTWRGRIYPERPGTLEPAYVVSNKIPYVFETFEKGETIRARNGGMLIPVGAGLRIRLAPGESHAARVRKARAQYGQLSFFQTRKGLFLGAWNKTAKGKDRFVPLFLVRKAVQAPDLLNAEEIARRHFARFPDSFMLEMTRVYEQLQARPG